MARFVPACLPFISQLYQHLFVIATPGTAAETVAPLNDVGAHLHCDGDEHVGENRRRILRRAVESCDAPYLHYCDFDRLLHWTMYHRDELPRVVQHDTQRADYTAIGRNDDAFASHPPVQCELEAMTNRVFSFTFGQEMDVTAGSCAISRPAAAFLIENSIEMSNATDTEWPMLVGLGAGLRVQFVAVRGLEFETATFYGEEVYEQADNPQNWRKRTQLARDSIEAVIRVANTYRR
jgi:hypothetical protein